MTPRFDYSALAVPEWPGAKSLAWTDDALIDWIQSARVYGLDGSLGGGGIHYGYRFDAVATSPSGTFVVLYERLGTKGIVLRDGRVIREIARSYYQADAFDFPICLFRLADGREAIAHAPDDYNRIEIDLLESGTRLTARPSDAPEPVDYFPSALAANPTGKWLMSAGWVWHPSNQVAIFSIVDALSDPAELDADRMVEGRAEITSGCWIDGDRAVLASEPEADCYLDDDETQPNTIPYPGKIGIYRPATGEWDGQAVIDEPIGQLLAVDDEHVLALRDHPKLIHVRSGKIVDRWPDIASGPWAGCITHHLDDLPPVAWDPKGRRLAVAAPGVIHILTLTDAA